MSVTVQPSLHLKILSGPHAGITARSTGTVLVAGRAASSGLCLRNTHDSMHPNRIGT